MDAKSATTKSTSTEDREMIEKAKLVYEGMVQRLSKIWNINKKTITEPFQDNHLLLSRAGQCADCLSEATFVWQPWSTLLFAYTAQT